MEFLNNLCPPAFIYLGYIVAHTAVSLAHQRFVTALITVAIGVSGVIFLDILCDIELGVISWIVVLTPFIIVALAASISLGLGMDHALWTKLEKFTNKAGLTADDAPLSTSSMY